MSKLTLEERFWSKIDAAGDCWEYTAGLDRYGYGQFALTKKTKRSAHRYAYTLLVGPIPDGLDLDHLCRVRHCVNPDHLEPVTRAENLRRSYAVKAARAAWATSYLARMATR